MSAVCVQRMPSITREKTELELRYEELKDTMRAERSRLSDFELDEAKHLEMKKEREKRALEEDIDAAQVCNCEVYTLLNLYLSLSLSLSLPLSLSPSLSFSPPLLLPFLF